MSRMKNRELFSFSKLTTFHTCPYSYYLTYIEKEDRKDNVYSFLGGKIHELLEYLQRGEKTKEEAKELFLEYLSETEILGYDFPTENSGNNFKECILDYFDNYEPFTEVDFQIEEYFEVEIGGIPVRGYIDIYTITDNKYIDIYDYKSSSKFSKKDLEVKKLQLVIYALALKEKYPDKEIRGLYFDMLKYSVNERGTVKERNKLCSTKERAFVEVPFDEENINQAIDFVRGTHNSIKDLDPLDPDEWEANVSKFFCSNLCSNYSICPYIEKK